MAKVSIYMSCDGLMKISDYLCTVFGLHGVVSVQRHTLAQKIRYFASRTIPLCFHVWGYAPYNPSTANQLKCSSLRSIISLDSWFRLLIPYSHLTLALWNNNPGLYFFYIFVKFASLYPLLLIYILRLFCAPELLSSNSQTV